MSKPTLLGEIPSFRTKYSDTYATAQGFYLAKVYASPVNYRGADGSWQPIDDTLVRSGSGYVNKGDVYRATLPGSLGSTPVSFSIGGDSVSVRLDGASAAASAAASVSGRTASYHGVAPGLDATYEAVTGALKGSLTLADAAAGSPVTFDLRASSGLNAIEHDGAILFQDAQGKTVIGMPAPFMLDANEASGRTMPSDFGPVSVSMTQAGGAIRVTYTPDQSWLHAPGRAFPVHLDPSFVSPSNYYGLNAQIPRTYNNLTASPGPFGNGSASVDGALPYIYTIVNDALYLVTPDGGYSVWTADPNNANGYLPPPGIDASMCTIYTSSGCPGLISGAAIQVTFQSGEKWEFAAIGGIYRLIGDIDQNGNQITYQHNGPSSAVSQSTDTHGRTLSYSYNASGDISQITDNAGSRSTSYTYNGSGQLTGFTDASSNPYSYSYDSSGNLIQITDPAGEITKLAYSGNRVTSITRVTNNQAGTGDTTTYAYYSPQNAPISCTTQGGLGWYGETVETDPNGNQTTYCYDTHDRVFETFDAYGYHSEETYDLDDNVVASQDPLGNQSQSTVDSCYRPALSIAPLALPGISTTPARESSAYGQSCNYTSDYQASTFEPTTTTDAQNNTISYSYDNNGNLQTETLPLAGNPQIVTHHVLSNQCSGGATCYGLMDYSKDADGHQTNYSYYSSGTSAGDLQTVTPPSPVGAVSYTYDADSRVISETDGKGQKTTFQYDALDRVTQETHYNSSGGVDSTVSYTYDADGNILKRVDSQSGTSTYSYDLKNRVTNETSPGVTNAYTYDGADNLKTVSDAGGSVTYAYDHDNRVTSVQEPNVSNPITFSYDPDSRKTCTTYPNGVVIQNRYDNASDLLSTKAANGSGAACNTLDPNGTPNGSVFSSYVYTYNVGGTDTTLRQTTSINGESPFYFSYDSLNRLIEWNGGNLPGPLYYNFDPAGNITRIDTLTNGTITTTNYAHNSANQITNSGYSYDANGNLVTRPDAVGTTSLGYNPRNQTSSINPDGSGAQTLSYLGDGQKDPTQIGNAPPGGTAATLENNILGISSQATAASQGQQPSVTYYTRDIGGGLLSQRTPGGNYYYVEDCNGSIVAVTDASGNVADTYTYDPWGHTTSSSGSAPNSFGYDEGFQSQGGLYHFGARYYDPTSANWTQPDPSGGGYTYAGDDPVNSVDPSGLTPCEFKFGGLTGLGSGLGTLIDHASVWLIGHVSCNRRYDITVKLRILSLTLSGFTFPRNPTFSDKYCNHAKECSTKSPPSSQDVLVECNQPLSYTGTLDLIFSWGRGPRQHTHEERGFSGISDFPCAS